MSDCIVTDGLTKGFGRVQAVRGVSIHVKEGEIYGFLGLNGAGKTTTIRMLLGMINPSSGAAYVYGRRIGRDSSDLWKEVGYMVETPFAYPDLTVRENVEIFRRLHGLPDRSAVGRVIERLGLAPYADRRAGHLSLGNKQRLGLAKALLHTPKLLILDEPANGLDPEGIVEIRELLASLARNEGVTIFVSSHILEEISRFAGRIGIIHEGSLIQEVDSGELASLLRKRLQVKTLENERARAVLEHEGYETAQPATAAFFTVENERAVAHPEEVATLLVHAGASPTMLAVEGEDLESYFLRIVGSARRRNT